MTPSVGREHCRTEKSGHVSANYFDTLRNIEINTNVRTGHYDEGKLKILCMVI